jgi:hypothetical protein
VQTTDDHVPDPIAHRGRVPPRCDVHVFGT